MKDENQETSVLESAITEAVEKIEAEKLLDETAQVAIETAEAVENLQQRANYGDDQRWQLQTKVWELESQLVEMKELLTTQNLETLKILTILETIQSLNQSKMEQEVGGVVDLQAVEKTAVEAEKTTLETTAIPEQTEKRKRKI